MIYIKYDPFACHNYLTFSGLKAKCGWIDNESNDHGQLDIVTEGLGANKEILLLRISSLQFSSESARHYMLPYKSVRICV